MKNIKFITLLSMFFLASNANLKAINYKTCGKLGLVAVALYGGYKCIKYTVCRNYLKSYLHKLLKAKANFRFEKEFSNLFDSVTQEEIDNNEEKSNEFDRKHDELSIKVDQEYDRLLQEVCIEECSNQKLSLLIKNLDPSFKAVDLFDVVNIFPRNENGKLVYDKVTRKECEESKKRWRYTYKKL